MYRTIEHQADIAVEVEASDRAGLFRAALQALKALLTDETDYTHGTDYICTTISASGFDDEERLVDILNELLYISQVQRQFPVGIGAVYIDDDQNISAEIQVLAPGSGKSLSREIKAATYHNLKIISSPSWRTKIVFDV